MRPVPSNIPDFGPPITKKYRKNRSGISEQTLERENRLGSEIISIYTQPVNIINANFYQEHEKWTMNMNLAKTTLSYINLEGTMKIYYTLEVHGRS